VSKATKLPRSATGLFAIVLLAGALQPDRAHCAFEDLSAALTYCRSYPNTVTLKDDQSVLCFDGPILKQQDDALFRKLSQHGLFVVRSTGGHAPAAIRLANILREKEAIVVIYDYCVSACADFFFVASGATFVMKKTIVAWHGTGRRFRCIGDTIEIVGWERRETRYLSPRSPAYLHELCSAMRQITRFFKERNIDDKHIYEPQPDHIRKLFASAIEHGGSGKKIVWMWHPRNYGDYFKIPIAYESYPASQEEVDQIVSNTGLRAPIIYDPPTEPPERHPKAGPP
jgi:hypothetical protein